MKQIIIVVLFALAVNYSRAQSTYLTNDGYVIITGLYNGNIIFAQSHKLNLLLNYKTKDFIGNLNIRNLETGVESLDSLNKNEDLFIVQFTGTIPNDDFITWQHAQINMQVLVTVTMNEVVKEVIMNANLEHYYASPKYVCLLTGSMDIELSEFNLAIEGLANSVTVQFVKLLLRLQEK